MSAVRESMTNEIQIDLEGAPEVVFEIFLVIRPIQLFHTDPPCLDTS